MQALGSVWGDETGLARDHFPRPELEKREIVMLKLLRHDKAHISDATPALGGRYTLLVDLTQGELSANVKFTVAKGSSNRWYVQDFDSTVLQNKGFGRNSPS